MDQITMKIGELARKTNTQPETIRFYERQGLLPQTVRTDANYRVYLDHHVERLSFIRHCRGLDMTLDEIHLLLRFKDEPGTNCAEVNALLDEHIGHVDQRMAELRRLKKQLRTLRLQCANDRAGANCGILNTLTQTARDIPAVEHVDAGHVHGAHKRGRARHAND